MRVFVYWNLNKDCFSVRALEGANKGKVVAHAQSIELAKVTFAVGHAGRLQVLKGGHKQVHAGMRGILVSLDQGGNAAGMQPITYNPRRDSSFVLRSTGAAIHTATHVVGLTTNGKADCYAV